MSLHRKFISGWKGHPFCEIYFLSVAICFLGLKTSLSFRYFSDRQAGPGPPIVAIYGCFWEQQKIRNCIGRMRRWSRWPLKIIYLKVLPNHFPYDPGWFTLYPDNYVQLRKKETRIKENWWIASVQYLLQDGLYIHTRRPGRSPTRNTPLARFRSFLPGPCFGVWAFFAGQSATEWTASVHTLHMSKPVM